jgi:hypothetical protein
LIFWVGVVEPPFALLQREVEAGSRDAVETAYVALGLVPEVLDAVDVILAIGEEFGVVDAEVLKADTSSTL